jgi:peptide/nickel transport system permease protein
MNWWQQLKTNNLARLGGIILILLYTISIGAEFVAPYSPYESQKDGSLLFASTVPRDLSSLYSELL